MAFCFKRIIDRRAKIRLLFNYEHSFKAGVFKPQLFVITKVHMYTCSNERVSNYRRLLSDWFVRCYWKQRQKVLSLCQKSFKFILVLWVIDYAPDGNLARKRFYSKTLLNVNRALNGRTKEWRNPKRTWNSTTEPRQKSTTTKMTTFYRRPIVIEMWHFGHLGFERIFPNGFHVQLYVWVTN